ncbi:MAG: hypothetical protein AAFU49_03375 [Pseudomonadota bacterium]
MTSSVDTQGRQALTAQQEAWTDAVMKLLKLSGQKRKQMKKEKGIRIWSTDSLHNRYSEAYERSVIEDRTAAEKRLEDNEKELEDLRLEIIEKTKTATQEELQELEERREELIEEIEEDKTALELMDSTKMRLDTLDEVEGDLSGQLDTLGEEITELQRIVDEAFPNRQDAIDGLNTQEANRFRFEHDAIAKQIEDSLLRVFELKRIVPGPDNTTIEQVRNYTQINKTEYAILYGMLEKAELLFLAPDSGLKEAMIELERTRRKLAEFVAARRGWTAVYSPTKESTPVDGFLRSIEGKAALLQTKGYAHAADQLLLQHSMLETQVQRQAKTDPSQIAPKFLASIQNLIEQADREYELMKEVEAELAKVEVAIRTFKANGKDGFAHRAQTQLESFDRDRPLSECLEDARSLVSRYEGLAGRDLDEQLEDETEINREQLESRLETLRETYDSLFKHEKDGSVKMIIDTQTRDEKGAKKYEYRKVPREAIREFELMMQGAEQLLESGSVDALKKAEMWLAGTQTAIDNVKRTPDLYSRLQYRYDALKNELNAVSKKYAQFGVGERAELMQELGECEKDLKTVFQAELESRLSNLESDVRRHRETCRKLKAQHKALTKEAKAIKGLLDDLGKLLVSETKKGNMPVEYDGYWGGMRAELKTIEGKIERGQKSTLNEAKTELPKLRTKAERMLQIFRRIIAGKDNDRKDLLDFGAFMRDCRAGQKTHTESEAVHEEYTDFKKDLETDIKTLVKKLKKLKMDPSDAEVLEQRRSTVRTEIKGSKDYPHGLAEMRKIREDYNTLKREADLAQEMVDKSLVEVARDVQSKVRTFREEITGFLADTVEPAGGDDYDDVDTDKVSTFLTMLNTAVPDTKVNDLVSKSAIVADGEQSLDDRKLARRVALAALRALMQVFDGFPAMAHYRANPFGGSESVGTLKRVLPRLEIKLLTALPKS